MTEGFDSQRSNVGIGWQPLVDSIHMELVQIDPDYKVEQIKEKFGGLRYYFMPSCGYPSLTGPENEYTKEGKVCHELWVKMKAVVAKYTEIAAKTCEDCGAQGGTVVTDNRFPGDEEKGTPGTGWIRTLCDPCRHNDQTRWAARFPREAQPVKVIPADE